MSAYKWAFKPLSYIKADAQKTGELCKELENTVGLTAKTLLDASRDKDALLHNEFEWDNDVAAENWREQQARHIINSIIVVSEEQQVTPVFCNVVSSGVRQYKSVETVIKTPALYEQLMENAYKDLQSFTSKYERLSNTEKLKNVFIEIKKVTKEN